MGEAGWVHLIALFGWLVLAAGALAAYRLQWRQALVMALVWGAIFAGATLFFSLVT